MSFISICLICVFLAGFFLFILNQNIVFRIIKRKLRWWILMHWGVAILTVLGKYFLVLTGPLQIFKGLKFGESFAENWRIVQNRSFSFSLPWKDYQLNFGWFLIFYLVAVLIYTQLAYFHMYIGYCLEDDIRQRLVQFSLTRYIQLPFLQMKLNKSKIKNILLLDVPALSLYFGGGNKGVNFNQMFYQSADALLFLNLTIKSLQNWQGIWVVLRAIFLRYF